MLPISTIVHLLRDAMLLGLVSIGHKGLCDIGDGHSFDHFFLVTGHPLIVKALLCRLLHTLSHVEVTGFHSCHCSTLLDLVVEYVLT